MTTRRLLWRATWRGSWRGTKVGVLLGAIYGCVALSFLLVAVPPNPYIAEPLPIAIIYGIELGITFGLLFGALLGAIAGLTVGLIGGLIAGLVTRYFFYPLLNKSQYQHTIRFISALIVSILGGALFVVMVIAKNAAADLQRGLLPMVIIILIPTLIATVAATFVARQEMGWYENEMMKEKTNA